MLCHRKRTHRVHKKGFYIRRTGRTHQIQRYFCHECRRTFSRETRSFFRRERKRHINQRLFRLFCSGMSQRRIAIELNIHRTTVHRKLIRLGICARIKNARLQKKKAFAQTSIVVFDEMETFEHTRCKPLSIAVAVDKKTRKIIASRVSRMPAKGLLAEIAKRKYGFRPDRRRAALERVLRTIKRYAPHICLVRSDECPRYPGLVRKHFPGLLHEQFKGRRAAVVGQGELKRGGFDPLFSLNHSAAMYRDNLKRLTRKTWCTTKSPARLQDLVDLYTWYHNQVITYGWHRVQI